MNKKLLGLIFILGLLAFIILPRQIIEPAKAARIRSSAFPSLDRSLKVLDSPFEVAALSSIAKPKGLKQAFLQRRL